MAEQRSWQEKPEKQDEKQEKQNEKDEKARGEKRPADRLSSIVFAAILIWAGLVLLATTSGWFAPIREQVGEPWAQTGSWIMLGVGAILLAEVAARLTLPLYRRPVGGTLVLAVILLVLGLGNVIGLDLGWPVILIVVGVALLLSTFLRRQ